MPLKIKRKIVINGILYNTISIKIMTAKVLLIKRPTAK